MVILDSIKKSMRIDHTIDDDFIQQLIDTAGEYIKSAIDSSATDKDMDNYQQFDLAVTYHSELFYLGTFISKLFQLICTPVFF
uniref:Phage gp6-like head-tail connector protein, partial n=1 Tax=Enterococcus phage Entfac.YE1 TaxID=2803888 RepID=A0A830ZXI8_9CAUD|nr:phage gp6-like head-tail connector protein [Enterococcus phage Entfac.YE1]